MMPRFLIYIFLLSASLLLSNCSNEDVAVEDAPAPIAMTEEAVGHYCSMSIFEHTGPKAQIHLKNLEFPIWFSQVRDAIAYTRLPEETNKAVAIYVHDMAKAVSWEAPGDGAWIDIKNAYFVIESKKNGGMGAPETIPFGTKAQAQEFADINDGRVVVAADIPDQYVLGAVDIESQIRGNTQ